MKRSIIITLLIAWMVVQNVPPASAVQQGLTVAIQASHNVVKIGEDVPVTIIVNNKLMEERTIRYCFHSLNGIVRNSLDNNVIVAQMNGKAVRRIATYDLGKNGEPDRGIFSCRVHTLEPGEQQERKVLLNRLYDMSIPTAYVVQVTVENNPSNKLHISVSK